MAVTFKNRGIVKLDAALVNRYRNELSHVPGERNLKPQRLKFIRELISRGDFVCPHFGEAVCKENGKTYRVNGQHTSFVLGVCLDAVSDDISDQARQLLRIAPGDGFYELPAGDASIDHWQADNVVDLKLIFDYYDNPASQRNATDKLGIYSGEYHELVEIPRKDLQRIMSGVVSYCKVGEEVLGFSEAIPDQRNYGQLLAHVPFREYVVWASDAIEDRELFAVSWASRLVFESYVDDGRETAADIWHQVYEEDDLAQQAFLDEDHELYQELKNLPGRQMMDFIRSQRSRGSRKLKPDQAVKKCHKFLRLLRKTREEEKVPA